VPRRALPRRRSVVGCVARRASHCSRRLLRLSQITLSIAPPTDRVAVAARLAPSRRRRLLASISGTRVGVGLLCFCS